MCTRPAWKSSGWPTPCAASILRCRVPTCPDWSLADLVRHTGTVHRWATRMVRDLAPQRLDPRSLDLGLPDDEAGYADWLASGARELVTTFGAADPDAAMWAWGADQHVRFWPRRMVHETTVHRADAELASGVQPRIDPATAADGIDELLDNLPTAAYFRPASRSCGARVSRLRCAASRAAMPGTSACCPTGSAGSGMTPTPPLALPPVRLICCCCSTPGGRWTTIASTWSATPPCSRGGSSARRSSFLPMTGRLEGKVAVVTGAGGGLGAAMSVRFAEEGAAVVCQDLDEAAALRTVYAIAEARWPVLRPRGRATYRTAARSTRCSTPRPPTTASSTCSSTARASTALRATDRARGTPAPTSRSPS